MKENSAAQELIMDNEEDMTLSQLGTCRIGHSSDIATEDLSTNDCETKKSDESDGVNDNLPMPTSKLTVKLKNT